MLVTPSDNVVMSIALVVLCFLGINGKPSLSFSLPQIGPFGYLGKEPAQSLKIYSGKRVDSNSIRMVYFNDLTVAIVELGPHKLLLNCELIEIFETGQVFNVLGELKEVSRPVAISLPEMLTLMTQCKELADATYLSQHREIFKNKTWNGQMATGINNPFTLINGIIPGTKWCGTGDIAKDYFDLGTEANVDACCRTHDLCPLKIRGHTRRYNLTNDSLYTKSYCKCDDDLFNCLKSSDSSTGNLLGNIYFNLVQVPCIAENSQNKKYFRGARNNF